MRSSFRFPLAQAFHVKHLRLGSRWRRRPWHRSPVPAWFPSFPAFLSYTSTNAWKKWSTWSQPRKKRFQINSGSLADWPKAPEWCVFARRHHLSLLIGTCWVLKHWKKLQVWSLLVSILGVCSWIRRQLASLASINHWRNWPVWENKHNLRNILYNLMKMHRLIWLCWVFTERIPHVVFSPGRLYGWTIKETAGDITASVVPAWSGQF